MIPWIVCLSLLFPPAGQDSAAPRIGSPERVRAETPKLESPEAQLQHAAKLKSALRGTEGERRKAQQAEVVAAYRAVRQHWPAATEACAEAAFRAGELLRASGDQAGAQAEFEVVLKLQPATAFRSRAGIEIGHLHRRARRLEAALDAYLAVAGDPKTEPQRRDEAALWSGRAYAELGKPDEARRQWEAVATRAEDPLQRIDAWDELALALVDAGDLEGAAGWLAKARETLSDAALEETAQGERIRSALEKMRAIRKLERAVRARDGDASKGK